MSRYIYLSGLILWSLTGCNSTKVHHSRSYYYKENFEPKGNKDSLILNGDYVLYVRKIYRDTVLTPDSSYFLRPKPTRTIQQYTLSDKEPDLKSGQGRLIELEYILYSQEKQQFIYLTTVPDLNQRYYWQTRQQDNAADTLNVYDFNTFHLGIVANTPDSLEKLVNFKALKKHIYYKWEVKIRHDSLFINRIREYYDNIYFDERSVANSINSGAKFARSRNYDMIFRSPDVGPLFTDSPTLHLVKPKNKYCVYFQFTLPATTSNRRSRDRKKKNVTILFKSAKHVPVNPLFKP